MSEEQRVYDRFLRKFLVNTFPLAGDCISRILIKSRNGMHRNAVKAQKVQSSTCHRLKQSNATGIGHFAWQKAL